MPLVGRIQVLSCRYTTISKSSFNTSTSRCRAVKAKLPHFKSTVHFNILELPCNPTSGLPFVSRRSYASATPKQAPASTRAKVATSSPYTHKPNSATAQQTATSSRASKPHEVESSKSFTGVRGTPLLPPSPQGKRYPERLLIYNAGTARLVFISSVKLTAIFVFIFSSVLIAPAYYFSPLEPTWMAAAVVVGGAIPILFTAFTTPPFVSYVHLALPSWARASYPRLMRYARNLPASASIDVTTLRWIWPRVTRLSANELYIWKSQLGSMTLRRTVPQAVLDDVRWYSWRPLRKFYVAGSGGKSAEKGIWEEVLGAIVRGWGKKSAQHEGVSVSESITSVVDGKRSLAKL